MRKSLVAMFALAAPLAVMPAGSSQTPVQGSMVLPWEEIDARPSPNGRSKSIVRAATATLDELESHITVLPAGVASHPPHRHPQEEVIIVRDGTLDVNVNGKIQRVGPGAFVFFASNDEHGMRNVGDTPSLYYVIQWKSPGSTKAAP